MPGPVRGGLHAGHQRPAGEHQAHRAADRRAGVPGRLGRAGPAAHANGQARGGNRFRPGRTGRGPADQSRRPRDGGFREGRSHRRAAALRHPGLQAGEARHRPPLGTDVAGGRPLPVGRGCRPRHDGRRIAQPVRRRLPLHGRGPPAAAERHRIEPPRRPPGDGLPQPAEPPRGRGRSARRRRPRDHRHGQARDRGRRRRHGQRLRRHVDPPGRDLRHPVGDPAQAARRQQRRNALARSGRRSCARRRRRKKAASGGGAC